MESRLVRYDPVQLLRMVKSVRHDQLTGDPSSGQKHGRVRLVGSYQADKGVQFKIEIAPFLEESGLTGYTAILLVRAPIYGIPAGSQQSNQLRIQAASVFRRLDHCYYRPKRGVLHAVCPIVQLDTAARHKNAFPFRELQGSIRAERFHRRLLPSPRVSVIHDPWKRTNTCRTRRGPGTMFQQLVDCLAYMFSRGHGSVHSTVSHWSSVDVRATVHTLVGGPNIDAAPRLFLFDIDGTILRGGTVVHRAAFAHAFQKVYDLALTLDRVKAAGRTDTWLLVEPLRRSGMSDADIWARMPLAFTVMAEYVEEHLADLRGSVLPGVPEVLARLQEMGFLLGLLTGNLSRIACAKMEQAGLAHYFSTGGFGEESMNRPDLVPVALAHAVQTFGLPLNAGQAVLIGDTPLDVEAGQEHGALTCGVATGRFSADVLRVAGARLVLESLADYDRAVEELVRIGR